MCMKKNEYDFYFAYKDKILNSEIQNTKNIIEVFQMLHNLSLCPRCLAKMGDRIDDDFVRIEHLYNEEMERKNRAVEICDDFEKILWEEINAFWKANGICSNEEFIRGMKMKNILKK